MCTSSFFIMYYIINICGFLPMSDESSEISLLLRLTLFNVGMLYKASGTRGKSLQERSTSVNKLKYCQLFTSD